MNRKKATMICFLIGFCFLWTGSGYLTWLYRLLDFYPSASVDVLTEVVGYVFQIIGLISFSLYCKRKIESLNNKKGFVIIMLGDFCFIVLSALAWNGPSALFFGYCMNWLHGIVAGFYLTMLVTHVSQQHRGRVFYQKMYFPILSEERNEELLLEDFTQEYGLSPREKEVFSLIKEGRSNSEIASDLYISENTVKFHIKNILKKTACVNRTELIILFKNQ